jgi:hypothetical protein
MIFFNYIYIYTICLWWRAFAPQTLKGLELIKVWSIHGAMLSPWTLPQKNPTHNMENFQDDMQKHERTTIGIHSIIPPNKIS